MKVKLLSLFGAGLLLLTSCSQENPMDETPVVSFTGKINNLQATTSTGSSSNWGQNDQIGVFMVDLATNNVINNYSNRQYIFLGGKFDAVAGQEIFFPVNDQRVSFISYSPYKSEYQSGTSINLNYADQTNISSLDLLFTKADNGGVGYSKTSSSSVPLVFDHKMSKIVIKPIPGAGLSKIDPSWNSMSIVINGLNTTCTFDPQTGIVSAPSVIASVTPFVNSVGVSYEAIIIPYVYSGGVSFSFTVAGNTYIYKSPVNESFEAGKEYTYTITINKTGVVLGTIAVNDWISVSRAATAN